MYGPQSENGNRVSLLLKNESDTLNNSLPYSLDEYAGVIPRAVCEVFGDMAKNPQVLSYSIYCSFVQIYNEQLFDMLR